MKNPSRTQPGLKRATAVLRWHEQDGALCERQSGADTRFSQPRNRANEARPRIKRLARNHALARNKNQRKLQGFRQQRDPADFSVSAGAKTIEPTGYPATGGAPEVECAKGEFAWSGPVRVKVNVKVNAINPGAYFQVMGIMAVDATLRVGPGENAQMIRTVSGPEIGFPVEPREE